MAQIITIQNNATALTKAALEAVVAALKAQALNDYNKCPWVTHGYSEAIQDVMAPAAGAIGWHLEFLDTTDQPGAIGYHEDKAFTSSLYSTRGLAAGAETPLAKVFVKTAREAGVEPSEVASHELLEMMVDPYVINEATVRKYLDIANAKYYIAEVGDPVQGEGYAGAGGVTVANFCFPAWWGVEPLGQRDQRGTRKAAFELAPNGYISVQSKAGQWEQIFGEGTPVVEPAPEPKPEPEIEWIEPPEACPCEEQIAALRKRIEALEGNARRDQGRVEELEQQLRSHYIVPKNTGVAPPAPGRLKPTI